MVVAKGGGEWENVGQRVQTFIYEMHMFWRSNEQHGKIGRASCRERV